MSLARSIRNYDSLLVADIISATCRPTLTKRACFSRREIRRLTSPQSNPAKLKSNSSKPIRSNQCNRVAYLHRTAQLYSTETIPRADINPIQELQGLSSTISRTQDDELPWYLRNNSATAVPQPQVELPPIPEGAPTLLLPILTYLGTARSALSDLTIMDLRALEPSPALGSNLIMILGNARSGQHVHAFSDRFCRWLRSEHRLRPSADGLLGRQQVKIWRRRAAKKVRALALAGAGAGIEDKIGHNFGISDWVCVHLGDMPSAGESFEAQTVQPNEGFIGFDTMANRVTVAVHILTEERRSEIDLEGFWESKLENMRRRIIRDRERIKREQINNIGS
jgi:hypothetical protein